MIFWGVSPGDFFGGYPLVIGGGGRSPGGSFFLGGGRSPGDSGGRGVLSVRDWGISPGVFLVIGGGGGRGVIC